MKRFLTTATVLMMLAASGVYAQQPADPPRHRAESQWSPFTYEYLGATPRVDLGRLFAPRAAKAEAEKAAAARTADGKATPADAAAHASAPQGGPGRAASTH